MPKRRRSTARKKVHEQHVWDNKLVWLAVLALILAVLLNAWQPSKVPAGRFFITQDLVVSKMDCQPNPVTLADTVICDITIENNGLSDSDFTASLYLGNGKEYKQIWSSQLSFSPGESRDIPLRIFSIANYYRETGTYFIRFYVDSARVVEESDELNNIRIDSVEVV